MTGSPFQAPESAEPAPSALLLLALRRNVWVITLCPIPLSFLLLLVVFTPTSLAGDTVGSRLGTAAGWIAAVATFFVTAGLLLRFVWTWIHERNPSSAEGRPAWATFEGLLPWTVIAPLICFLPAFLPAAFASTRFLEDSPALIVGTLASLPIQAMVSPLLVVAAVLAPGPTSGSSPFPRPTLRRVAFPVAGLHVLGCAMLYLPTGMLWLMPSLSGPESDVGRLLAMWLIVPWGLAIGLAEATVVDALVHPTHPPGDQNPAT